MVEMNQSVIDVRNLKVEFPGRRGTVTALSDISLRSGPAKFWVSSANPAPGNP